MSSAATIQWDGSGDGSNWEDPLNWDGDVLPGTADSVQIFSSPGGLNLSSDQAVGFVFFAAGSTTNHTGGKLQAVSVDLGGGGAPVAIPGNSAETYAMSGNAHIEQGGGFMFIAGGVGSVELTMRDTSQLSGSSTIGLGGDGGFLGTLQDDASMSTVGRLYIDPVGNSSSLTLTDRSTISAGSIYMDTIAPDFGSSMLSFIGSSVDASSGALLISRNSTLSFVSDINGISTLFVDGQIDLMHNGALAPLLSVDLNAYVGADPMTLIDGTQLAAGQFRDLPEGAVVPGSGGRRITYSGGDGFDIMLLAVPEPSSPLLFGLGLCGALLGRRRR